MKNLIISVLATYIFYTQFCEVKNVLVLPFLVLFFYMVCYQAENIKEIFR